MYKRQAETVEVVNKFSNADGKQVFRLTEKVTLQPGERKVVKQQSPVQNPVLWSTENPYLYKLASMIKRGKSTTDEISTVSYTHLDVYKRQIHFLLKVGCAPVCSSAFFLFVIACAFSSLFELCIRDSY